MKYIVAVSGGVDSVVLLDMLTKGRLVLQEEGEFSEFTSENEAEGLTPPKEIIVAHFEHGIRGESSKSDARFVEKLSQKYRVKYEIGYGNLTKNTSEDAARQKRYAFLKKVAAKYDGQIVTAHHQNDLVETIAINLVRGTGWRGLAVFGDKTILRPLLGMTKTEVYQYALKHNLEWVEDETNQTDAYLRNRIRRKLNTLLDDEQRKSLRELYEAQAGLSAKIEREVGLVIGSNSESRYFFTMISESVALELLRSVTHRQLTRPQLERALLAVKTFKPGSVYEAGAGILFSFTTRRFVVTNTSQMI